jgi:S-adenosylmethionine-diacylglycerol 3-amino-3-carboxypropyl transferase
MAEIPMMPAPDPWAVKAASLPLAFAQVREDPRLDLELANTLPPGATVVMIASGGDTAVCLGRLPLCLHLVDMNPAQLALSRVKWQLAGQGDRDMAAALLGHLPLQADERWEILNGMLGSLGLAGDALGPKEMVAVVGPDHAGRYEITFAELRSRLAPWASLLDAALTSEVPITHHDDSALGEAMDSAFADVMKLENLVCLFGEDATRNPRLPFSEHFASRTRETFRRMAPRSNPFLWQILAGRFHPEFPYDWLGEMSPLKAHPSWHCGKMDEVLESFPNESADMIHLSNILDWLSLAEGHTMLAKVERVLKPGGHVVIRQLNSTLEIPAIECSLIWDLELGRRMERRDRSYFYPQIFIGRKA